MIQKRSPDLQNLNSITDRSSAASSVPMCNLHMLVPVAARRHAKLAAVASGISFREFVARLLFDAKPLFSESVECLDQKSFPSATAPIGAGLESQ